MFYTNSCEINPLSKFFLFFIFRKFDGLLLVTKPVVDIYQRDKSDTVFTIHFITISKKMEYFGYEVKWVCSNIFE